MLCDPDFTIDVYVKQISKLFCFEKSKSTSAILNCESTDEDDDDH